MRITLDLANEAIFKTEKELGPIEVAINCAGIANANPAEEMSQDQWQNMFNINLSAFGAFCLLLNQFISEEYTIYSGEVSFNSLIKLFSVQF